jgi:hypothetical protein
MPVGADPQLRVTGALESSGGFCAVVDPLYTLTVVVNGLLQLLGTYSSETPTVTLVVPGVTCWLP